MAGQHRAGPSGVINPDYCVSSNYVSVLLNLLFRTADVPPYCCSSAVYPSEHESAGVGCHSHVTVRGLRDYMSVNRGELLTVAAKWSGNIKYHFLPQRNLFFCINW